MIGPFLVLIGLLMLWVAVKGKSSNLLTALGLGDVNARVSKSIGDNVKALIFDPLGKAIGDAIPTLPGVSKPKSGGTV